MKDKFIAKKIGITSAVLLTMLASHKVLADEVEGNSEDNKTAASETAVVDAPKVEVVASSDNNVKENSNLDNIRQELPTKLKREGDKYYYEDDKGEKLTDLSFEDKGKVYSLDKDGILTDKSKQTFTESLSSLNNSHNELFDKSPDSITTVDGFLVADSWYRPKEILRGGKKWEPSNQNDYRPLLMSWWPDKQTQVDYINYMSELGLGIDGGRKVSVDDSTEELLVATGIIQKKIESRIGVNDKLDWLRDVFASFIATQDKWNSKSESETFGKDKDHFQGGALSFNNDKLTPEANSEYRLFNRTPTNQTGVRKYTNDDSIGGYELLLANDIDNSNPVVQAEQLNWMHYLMNYGSIAKGNKAADFDGLRIDAVDNIDADILDIASDYFKAVYKINRSEKDSIDHLSILEDWSDNDPRFVKDKGNNQLSMDNSLRASFLWTLLKPLDKRSPLENLLTNSVVDRRGEGQKEGVIPTYTFVRAHDSEVQTVLADIIHDKIDPNTDGFTFTLEQLQKAFEIYKADQKKVDKEYTHSNIAAAYALMLTNKHSVPRVYYGDMWTDDGQFMDVKSDNFDAISALLKARVKYVAGGQFMDVHYVSGDSSMSPNDYKGVLSSVRYGKGINSSSDTDDKNSKTQGSVVLVSNNPKLRLSDSDIIKVNVGKVHANQAYRPVVLSTKAGLSVFNSDAEVPSDLIKYSDSEGNLHFSKKDIEGVATSQISGFLGMWVPVGADSKQDARTTPSTETNTTGATINSSDALDSQVIFEGFSNFQDFAKTPGEYTNVRIAQNAQFFKDLGITHFELAPQYVSSKDKTFLDSIIENGYAFTDRYNLALSGPNKYGTSEDLEKAIEALHKVGLKVLADYVPDQIYDLKEKEVVNVTRTNNLGEYRKGSVLKNLLYVTNTKGGGDYQAKYGGEFLEYLKKEHAELFTKKQVSTNKPLDSSTKIKKWSAKYLNGTNILGRGAYYVLKDWSTGNYLRVSKDPGEMFLPKQLIGESSKTGFINENGKISFYSYSGYKAKEQFIQYGKDWYYFDKDGSMVHGLQTIGDGQYYFLPNGTMLIDTYWKDADGKIWYFGWNGRYAPGGRGSDTENILSYSIDYHKHPNHKPYIPLPKEEPKEEKPKEKHPQKEVKKQSEQKRTLPHTGENNSVAISLSAAGVLLGTLSMYAFRKKKEN